MVLYKITEYPLDPWPVILSIILIILIVAYSVLLYLAVESRDQSYAEGSGTAFVTCPIGQCAVNIYNGEKRCPTSPEGQINSEIGLEICSSRTICDNPARPYALQSDGSTNSQGICEPNTACRCLAQPQCPEYIVSAFRTNTGNPYTSLSGQRTGFTQFTAANNTPIIYADDGQNFCTVPASWISRSSPGCSFIQEVTTDNMKICMGGPLGCTSTLDLFNPCAHGTLAYITDDSDSFDANSVQLLPMGCVAGNPCPCNLIAVYDTKANLITCRNVIE